LGALPAVSRRKMPERVPLHAFVEGLGVAPFDRTEEGATPGPSSKGWRGEALKLLIDIFQHFIGGGDHF
jgi:hypothetical protein